MLHIGSLIVSITSTLDNTYVTTTLLKTRLLILHSLTELRLIHDRQNVNSGMQLKRFIRDWYLRTTPDNIWHFTDKKIARTIAE